MSATTVRLSQVVAPEESVSNRPVKLLNVQVLRAYAALTVIFLHTQFHFGMSRPIGGFGVSTFFVISGFIISYICATNPDNFAIRRIARIAPLYWTATIAVFAIALFAPHLVQGTRANFGELLKSLLFIPFYKSGGLVMPVLFVGWSINDEMFFYAAIALALIVSRRCAIRIAFAGILAAWTTLHLAHSHRAAAVLYSDPIMLGFLLGIACFWAFSALAPSAIWHTRRVIAAAAFLAITGQIWLALHGSPAAVAIGQPLLASVIVFGAVTLDKVGYSIRWPWLILLGDASYATYLTHAYCVDALSLLGRHISRVLEASAFPGMVLAVATSQLVGIAVYLYLDKPAHDWIRKRMTR